MIKIRSDFGNLSIDEDTIAYYSVYADLSAKKYTITFYFKETGSSINTTLSTVDELVKIIKAIDFQSTFKRKTL
jgi:hypothetical protein